MKYPRKEITLLDVLLVIGAGTAATAFCVIGIIHFALWLWRLL